MDAVEIARTRELPTTPPKTGWVMQFHVLSFEGPDRYARAGGIASRVQGLVETLAESGYETHLWLVGDPELPGNERRDERLIFHRWCQWISAHHPGGVYDGELAKEQDYCASLPPYLVDSCIGPQVAAGQPVVVLAEEWHTAHAVLHLDWLLRRAGIRDRVTLCWNANNTFGFDRIDWGRLREAAIVTTVSRYMRQRMWAFGVDPIVIPNGLGPEAYSRTSAQQVQRLRERLEGRAVLTKMARFDPDKRWLHAIHSVAHLKAEGSAPLLIARGGHEAHGTEVLACARELGLRVGERAALRAGGASLVEALQDVADLDVVLIQSHIDASARRVLFRGADAVLANSAHEPFGLVGLETMAAGGVACTGGTGEDYVIPGRNALVLQTEDPREFLRLFERLRGDPAADLGLRRAARRSSRDFAWSEIVSGTLLPHLGVPSSVSQAARSDLTLAKSRAPAKVRDLRSWSPGRVRPAVSPAAPELSVGAS